MPATPPSADNGAAPEATASSTGGTAVPPSERGTTLYAVLSVGPTATTEEITAAYRKLALQHHPDRPGGSHAKFQELQRAYEVLNVRETRARYDALLKGKPALRNFKRPPPLESVALPVYALLADGAFYEFEAASSKLRCSFHYADGIQFGGDRGSFIGLAGDGYVYWIINGRGFASRLCEAGSSFALSSVRVMYRSNMGLRRAPLQRSSAPSPTTGRPAGSSGGLRPAGASERRSTSTGNTAAAASEASRIKMALVNRERGRNAKKRLDTIEHDEAEDRSYLELDLWEQLCLFHTTAEAALRCVRQGTGVPVEMALWMGYTSPVEVGLRSSGVDGSHSPAEPCSIPAPSLWVDPLKSEYYSDDEVMHDAEDNAATAATAAVHRDPASSQGSPCTSPSPRSMSASSSDDAASDEGRRRVPRRTAAPTTLTPPATTAGAGPAMSKAAAVGSSSSPLQPVALHGVHSSTSSLGNARLGSSATFPVPTATPATPSQPPPPLASPAYPSLLATAGAAAQAAPVLCSEVGTCSTAASSPPPPPPPSGTNPARQTTAAAAHHDESAAPRPASLGVAPGPSLGSSGSFPIPDTNSPVRPLRSGAPVPHVSDMRGGTSGAAVQRRSSASPAGTALHLSLEMADKAGSPSPPPPTPSAECVAAARSTVHSTHASATLVTELEGSEAAPPVAPPSAARVSCSRLVATGESGDVVSAGGHAAAASARHVEVEPRCLSSNAGAAAACDAAHPSPPITPLAEALASGSGVRSGGVVIAPLKLTRALQAPVPVPEPEAEPEPQPELGPEDADASGGPDDGAIKKKRSKGRITPRYMLSTAAHMRRMSAQGGDTFNTTTQSVSPRYDASRGYSTQTAEELFEEERAFMDSFAKTKKIS